MPEFSKMQCCGVAILLLQLCQLPAQACQRACCPAMCYIVARYTSAHAPHQLSSGLCVHQRYDHVSMNYAILAPVCVVLACVSERRAAKL